MAYTPTEVAQMYDLWRESGTDKPFKLFWDLTSEEMAQVKQIVNAEAD